MSEPGPMEQAVAHAQRDLLARDSNVLVHSHLYEVAREQDAERAAMQARIAELEADRITLATAVLAFHERLMPHQMDGLGCHFGAFQLALKLAQEQR